MHMWEGLMSNSNNQQQVQENNVQVLSFAMEKDFPEKSSRLKELITKYRREKSVDESYNIRNPLENVKINLGTNIKPFESLKPSEQQEVIKRMEGVDYTTYSSILNFGSAKESSLTKYAEVIISKYSAHEINALTDPLTTLVATLKSSPSATYAIRGFGKLEDREMGMVESIREFLALKKANEKMHKSLAQRETIMQNLQDLKIELERQKCNLQQDIHVYEEMGITSLKQVNEFGLDLVALNMMITEAQEKINSIVGGTAEVEEHGECKHELDYEEYYEVQNLQSAVERMQRRIHAISSVRVSTLQTLPMLATIIKGDGIICEKIDEVINLIIPMWSWQYAIAIGAIKQQEALNLHRTIKDVTSQLLTGNAKMLHDNMIATQEMLYTAAVAIEDLKVVQDYIEDMVTTVQSKAKESGAKIVEGMQAMQQIEKRNYDLIATSSHE